MDSLNVDFFKELYSNLNSNKKNNLDNICLISRDKLDDINIELDCKHKFNYNPLYLEVVNQKKRYNNLETRKLKINQIKCPYCRNIQNTLLPNIKEFNNKTIYGVNSPSKWTMKPKNNCNHIFKYGKKKDTRCKKLCFGSYCNTHKKKITTSLSENTVIELRMKCKTLNIKGYSKLKKADLIKLIEENNK
jgi:hypothetical protein